MRKKYGKTSVRVVEECQLATMKTEYAAPSGKVDKIYL
jgi:hypothetical protein